MGINVLDCRKPFVPFEDFYNEPLSDSIEMDTDYLNYKSRKIGEFSNFLLYSISQRHLRKCYANLKNRRHAERGVCVDVWVIYGPFL